MTIVCDYFHFTTRELNRNNTYCREQFRKFSTEVNIVKQKNITKEAAKNYFIIILHTTFKYIAYILKYVLNI